jgi:hypothetical protein
VSLIADREGIQPELVGERRVAEDVRHPVGCPVRPPG